MLLSQKILASLPVIEALPLDNWLHRTRMYPLIKERIKDEASLCSTHQSGQSWLLSCCIQILHWKMEWKIETCSHTSHLPVSVILRIKPRASNAFYTSNQLLKLLSWPSCAFKRWVFPFLVPKRKMDGGNSKSKRHQTEHERPHNTMWWHFHCNHCSSKQKRILLE